MKSQCISNVYNFLHSYNFLLHLNAFQYTHIIIINKVKVATSEKLKFLMFQYSVYKSLKLLLSLLLLLILTLSLIFGENKHSCIININTSFSNIVMYDTSFKPCLFVRHLFLRSFAAQFILSCKKNITRQLKK